MRGAERPVRGRLDGLIWVGYLGVGVVVAAAYLTMPAGAGALVYEAIGLSSVVAVIVGVRLHDPVSPTPWYLLACGLAFLTLGDSIFNANDLIFDVEPFPSIADAAYLSAYPFLCAGVVLLVRQRLPGQDSGSFVDALMLGVGCGVASWVFLMEPYAQDHGLRGIEQLVSIAYPAADVVLLVVVARLLLAPGIRPVAYTLLFAGLLLTLAGDTGFAWVTLNGSYGTPDPNDVLFLLSYLFVGAAVLHPSMVDLERRVRPAKHPGPGRLVLLGVAALTPAAFLLHEAMDDRIDHAAVVIGGSVAVPLLALWRVGLLMRELERHARLDPLTALPNRSMLFERIGDALERCRRTGTYTAVLYLDLDRFKLVNDAYGHAVGDELLIEVSERLRGALRHGDIVARVGGDEFVVLCELLSGQQAALAAADRLALALVDPIHAGAMWFTVSASIGIAVGDGDEAPDTLLNDADAAMYRAKEHGRGRAELFEVSMRQQTAAGSTRLDEDLHHAIARDQLRLYFQPQIDLTTGELVGVEALLRWQHPEWGTLPPATIVPIAEETGLIVPIGEWVISEACRHARAWADSGTAVEMTVNLSVRQLVEPGIVDKIADALTRHAVRADRFVIDVSGSGEAVHEPRAIASLSELRALGVHVAIDDFGPDAAPIGVLRALHADRLKLDRSLVITVTEGDADRSIIGALCALARELGMKVVAEGVETRSQRRELARLGCHDGLGHLWAPPLPPGSVLDQVLGREHSPV